MMRTSVSMAAFAPRPGMPVLFAGDCAESAAHIRALGYDGVDLFVDDPLSGESRAALTALTRCALGTGVVMPAALAARGLTLSDPSAEVRAKTLAALGEILRFAGELGAMVSLGLVRGGAAPGETPGAALARFAHSTAALLPLAQRCGVRLVIEPINRYEINTLNTSAEALAFIRDSALPVGLMLDTFHMNIEDVSLPQSFRTCLPLVWHVHFLDSNRLAPGMGHLDMAGLYSLLQTLGYSGYLCLEALPKPDALTCAQRGRAFFDAMQTCADGTAKETILS